MRHAEILKVIFLLSALQSCAPKEVVPPPEVQTRFLEHAELMKPAPERSPFALNWHVDNALLDSLKQSYSQFYIAPVNTKFLQQGEPPIPDEKIAQIANYLRDSFIKAIQRDTRGRYKIVDSPQPNTFVVELALIKLIPTTNEVNIVGNVGALFIPGAIVVTAAANVGVAVGAHEIGKGKIAMAMRVTDGSSGMLVGEVYDERDDRAALIINVQDFTRWGNARMIIRDWASEFSRLLNTTESVTVSAPPPLSLLLW